MGALGAVIGTIFAEISACFAQYWLVRKRIKCKDTLLKSMVYIACGVMMAIIVRCIAYLLQGGLLSLLIEIIVGALTYVLFAGSYVWFKDKELRKILFNK